VRSDHLQDDCCHRAYEYHIDEDEERIEHGTLFLTRGARLSLRGEVRCSKLLTFAILFGALSWTGFTSPKGSSTEPTKWCCAAAVAVA
jgi:hypothetical protein